jgi:hypothetical protein
MVQPSRHHVVVMGASSGWLEALMEIVARLPAALFVVVHVPAQGTGLLPQIPPARGGCRQLMIIESDTFCDQITHLLWAQINRSIKEIGDLNLSHTL